MFHHSPPTPAARPRHAAPHTARRLILFLFVFLSLAAETEPLGGVQIFLDTDTDGVWDSGEAWAISDASGDYSFESLEPPSYSWTYRVAESVPEGYTLTTPAL